MLLAKWWWAEKWSCSISWARSSGTGSFVNCSYAWASEPPGLWFLQCLQPVRCCTAVVWALAKGSPYWQPLGRGRLRERNKSAQLLLKIHEFESCAERLPVSCVQLYLELSNVGKKKTLRGAGAHWQDLDLLGKNLVLCLNCPAGRICTEEVKFSLGKSGFCLLLKRYRS